MDIHKMLFGVIAILVIVVVIALFTYWELCEERRTSELWLKTSEILSAQRDEAIKENHELKYRISCIKSKIKVARLK